MENEIKAVQEFLTNYVTPFFGNRLRPNVLKQLVCDADVLSIDADPDPYAPVKVDPNQVADVKEDLDLESKAAPKVKEIDVNQIHLIEPLPQS